MNGHGHQPHWFHPVNIFVKLYQSNPPIDPSACLSLWTEQKSFSASFLRYQSIKTKIHLNSIKHKKPQILLQFINVILSHTTFISSRKNTIYHILDTKHPWQLWDWPSHESQYLNWITNWWQLDCRVKLCNSKWGLPTDISNCSLTCYYELINILS